MDSDLQNNKIRKIRPLNQRYVLHRRSVTDVFQFSQTRVQVTRSCVQDFRQELFEPPEDGLLRLSWILC